MPKESQENYIASETTAPHQHLMLSAIQAAQYGVPLVRAATTGISAVVDARGMLIETIPVFKRDVLVRDLKKVYLPSPYSKFGDWFAWGCIFVSVTLLLLSCWRKSAGRLTERA